MVDSDVGSTIYRTNKDISCRSNEVTISKKRSICSNIKGAFVINSKIVQPLL